MCVCALTRITQIINGLVISKGRFSASHTSSRAGLAVQVCAKERNMKIIIIIRIIIIIITTTMYMVLSS